MRVLKLLAGGSALALGSLLVASPASAATLPDGQRIDVVLQVDVDGSDGAQSYRAEPDGSTSSPGVVLAEDIVAVDVGDDGLGYAVSDGLGQSGEQAYLYRFDANTGTFSDPLPMVSSNPADLLTECNGFDLTPSGELIASCEHNTDQGLLHTFIGVVTLEPGQAVLTAFLTTGTGFPLDEAIEFGELATDPISGTLWAFGQDPSGTFGWWTVSRDGTLGTQVEVDTELYIGADFDRSGQLWVTLGEDDGDSLLGTADPAAGTTVEIGPITFEGAPLGEVAPITVWGKPALPATGAADALPVTLGAVLLLLVGAGFVASARRRSA